MDDQQARIRELLLRIGDLEQEAEGYRAEARRLIRTLLASVSPDI